MGNYYARFGGRRMEKGPQGYLASRLPYSAIPYKQKRHGSAEQQHHAQSWRQGWTGQMSESTVSLETTPLEGDFDDTYTLPRSSSFVKQQVTFEF